MTANMTAKENIDDERRRLEAVEEELLRKQRAKPYKNDEVVKAYVFDVEHYPHRQMGQAMTVIVETNSAENALTVMHRGGYCTCADCWNNTGCTVHLTTPTIDGALVIAEAQATAYLTSKPVGIN